jgi:hypothetical protein
VLIIYEISLISIILLIAIGILLKYRYKKKGTYTPNPLELVGKKAFVSESIAFGGFGEISYINKDNSFIAPARSTNGAAIRAGKEVVICWIENKIAYVVSINDVED